MLKMSKLTDYGTLVLSCLAEHPRDLLSSAEVAKHTHLAVPTVSKLLKQLARAELVVSRRGAQGGYRLARDPRQISAADVIDALEGPVAITQCSSQDGHCDLESFCGVSTAWQKINVAIRRALDDISLAQLVSPGQTIGQFKLRQNLGQSQRAKTESP